METARTLRVVSKPVLFAIIAAVLLLLLPIWPYSESWGYYPGLVAAVLLLGLAALFFRLSPNSL